MTKLSSRSKEMQVYYVLGYLLRKGATERPLIEAGCRLSHASLWNVLEEGVREKLIETVGKGRPFKKAGMIRTYRSTPWGFFSYMKLADTMTPDFFHGRAMEEFRDLVTPTDRNSMIEIVRSQPYLWPWLAREIPIFEEADAGALMLWLAKTITSRGLYPEGWKVPGESRTWEELRTLWIEVSYPSTFERYGWFFGVEPHTGMNRVKGRTLKPQLERYLNARPDLRVRLRREWSSILGRAVAFSRAVSPILAELGRDNLG